MTEDRKFTQDDLDRAVYEALASRAKIDFEETTRNVLRQINRRLDEANNYKATIGADVKELKRKLEERDVRDQEDKRVSTEDALERRRLDDQRYVWHQDKWIRFGIVCAAAWEAISLLQSLGIAKAIHII